MKYLSRHCLAIVLGALAFGAQVQAQDFRVGFVNTDRIFREANTAKAAQAKLEQEFARRENSCSSLAWAALAEVASRKIRSVLTKPTRKSSARASPPSANTPNSSARQ